jgi:hypothetical protein
MGLGIRPALNPDAPAAPIAPKACRLASASEGKERTGHMLSPDLWGAQLTYMVCFVKMPDKLERVGRSAGSGQIRLSGRFIMVVTRISKACEKQVRYRSK